LVEDAEQDDSGVDVQEPLRVRPTAGAIRSGGVHGDRAAGYVPVGEGDGGHVRLIPDVGGQDRRVDLSREALRSRVGIGVGGQQCVHLVGGGERQQERPPQQREAGTVLPCSVDVDRVLCSPASMMLARVLIVCGLALICGPVSCCML